MESRTGFWGLHMFFVRDIICIYLSYIYICICVYMYIILYPYTENLYVVPSQWNVCWLMLPQLYVCIYICIRLAVYVYMCIYIYMYLISITNPSVEGYKAIN